MRKLICFLFIVLWSFNTKAQFFMEPDLISAKEVKNESLKLVKRFKEGAPRMTEEYYEEPQDSISSILQMNKIGFDFPIKSYIYGEIQFYYGYEIFTLANGSTIFYLSLVESDCCDYVSIFMSTSNSGSQIDITLTPIYEEKETLFFTHQEYIEYNIEVAGAMAYVNQEVRFGEKPLKIIEISTKTFLEIFKKVTENIWP